MESDRESISSATSSIPRLIKKSIDVNSNQALVGEATYQRVTDNDVKKIGQYQDTIVLLIGDLKKKNEQIKELSNTKEKKNDNNCIPNDMRSQFGVVKNELRETIEKLRSVSTELNKCKKELEGSKKEVYELSKEIEILKEKNIAMRMLVIENRIPGIENLVLDKFDNIIKHAIEQNTSTESEKRTDIETDNLTAELGADSTCKVLFDKIIKKPTERIKSDKNVSKTIGTELKSQVISTQSPNWEQTENDTLYWKKRFIDFKEQIAMLLSDSLVKVEATEDQVKEKIQLLMNSSKDRGLMITSMQETIQKLTNELEFQKNLSNELDSKYKVAIINRSHNTINEKTDNIETIKRLENRVINLENDEIIKRLENKLKKIEHALIDNTKKLEEKREKINDLESVNKKLKNKNDKLKRLIDNQQNEQTEGDKKITVPDDKAITIAIYKKGNRLESRISDN